MAIKNTELNVVIISFESNLEYSNNNIHSCLHKYINNVNILSNSII